MLQRTEPVETPLSDASTVVTAETEEVRAEEILLTPISDAELAELTSCIEAGVAHNKYGLGIVLRKIKTNSAVQMIGIAVVGLTALIAMSRGIISPTAGLSISIALMAIPLVIAQYSLRRGGMVRRVERVEQEHERIAAQRLAESKDTRVVAPLIDALHGIHLGASPRLELWQDFGRLSQMLNEEEALALGKERHCYLGVWLYARDLSPNSSHYAAMGNVPLLGILHILAHLGLSSMDVELGPHKKTVSLLAILEKWAAGEEVGQDPVVRQAAAACRDAILAKQAMARSRAQLLRASAPHASSPDTLLHPTQGAQPTDPQELLRPDESETGQNLRA